MSLLHLGVLQKDVMVKSIIIFTVHISGIANSAVSFSGVVIILNNSESNNIYLSANTSTLCLLLLELGNLFCVR